MKFSYAFFIIIILTVIYILISKEIIKQRFKENLIHELKLDYNFYKKAYKSSPKIGSLLIENEDYYDKSEMIDELSKSTPFLMPKDEMKQNKYDLTFAFFKKDTKKPNFITKKIASLEYEEFVIEETLNTITLFGQIEEKGYILITKYLNDEANIKKTIDIFFLKLLSFFLINTIAFIYFTSVIKKNKKVLSDVLKEFEYLKEDTKKLAFEDSLTKAASRIKFDETLKGLIQVASRFEQNYFGIIMFDIDNFKKVNDTYGHDFGDYILKSISSIVKNNIRGSDTFARWGGEEFVILSPMNDLEKTKKLAQKLKEKIEHTRFPKVGSVTCSFGVSYFQINDNEESIMKRVDNLLYKAKQNGKNRIES